MNLATAISRKLLPSRGEYILIRQEGITFRILAFPALVKAETPRPGERWITVHPHGEEGTGVPVLIRENRDGTHSIIGGAGGKLRHLRLTGIKPKEEYEDEQRKKAQEKRKQEHEHWQSLSEEEKQEKIKTIHEARRIKRGKEREFIETTRSKMGGVSEDLDTAKLKESGISDAAIEKRLQGHHKKQLKEAKQVRRDFKKRLLTDHIVRQKAEEAGISPEEIRSIIEEEREPSSIEKEKTGFASKYGAKSREVILKELEGLDSERLESEHQSAIAETEPGGHPAAILKEEAARLKKEAWALRNEDPEKAAKLYNKSEKRMAQYERTSVKDPKAAMASLMMMRLPRKVMDEVQFAKDYGIGEGEFTPLKDSEIAAGMEVLKAGAEYDRDIRELRDIEAKIKQGKSYNQGITLTHHEIEDAEIEKMVDEEAKDVEGIALARSLRGWIEEGHPDHYKHLFDGYYQTINNAQLAVSKESGLDRDVLDILGVKDAGRLLKWKWEQEGRDIGKITEALEKYHQEQAGVITKQALDEAQDYIDKAKAIDLGVLETGHDLAAAHEQVLARDAHLAEAQRILSTALGKMEATAALISVLKEPPPGRIEIGAGKGHGHLRKDVDEIANRFRVLGFSRDEMQVDPEARTVAVTAAHFGKLFQNPMTKEEHERNQKTLDIKAGKHDEKGWLPGGIVPRPATSFSAEEAQPGLRLLKGNENRSAFKLSSGADENEVKPQIEHYIGAEILAGKPIETVRDEMRSMAFRNSMLPENTSVRHAYDRHLNTLFPQALLTKEEDKEKLHALADRMARNAGIEAGDKNYAFHAQTIDMDHPQIKEAVFRALNDTPEGRFAWKAPGELSSQEQRNLRQYWYENFGKAGEALDEAEKKSLTSLSRAGEGKIGNRQPLQEWKRHVKQSGGENEAYKKIQEHVKAKALAGGEMFGVSIPGIAKVDLDDLDSLITHVAGSKAQQQTYRDALKKSPERSEEFKKDLHNKALKQLKDYWDEEIMKFLPEEMARYREEPIDPESAFKASWPEYVKSHGGLTNAQNALLTHIRGKYVEGFAKHYKAVTGNDFEMRREKLPGWREHVFGSVSEHRAKKIRRDEESKKKSSEAEVATRSKGKFAKEEEGVSRKEKGEEKRAEEAERQFEWKEALDINYGVGMDYSTPGKRIEAQIGSLITPNMQSAFRDNARTKLIKDIAFDGPYVNKQRSVKQIENQGRVYLAQGVGSGKTSMAIAGYTHLATQGKAKRALFIVPTQVQGQFGEEMKRFTEPGRFQWFAEPRAGFEKRLKAYKDSGLHMTVVTHQAFRDDMVKLMAQDRGVSPEQAMESFQALSESEQVKTIGATMKKHGIDYDYTALDEAHMLSNRAGKEASRMAAVIDAATHPDNVKYWVGMSGTPVKNDATEAFDLLKKIAPARYQDRDAFMRRYGVDIRGSKEALQREMAPHVFSGRIDPDVNVTALDNPEIKAGEKHHRDGLSLFPEQQKAYDGVRKAFQKAQETARGTTSQKQILETALSDPSETAKMAQRLHGLVGRKMGLPLETKEKLVKYSAAPAEELAQKHEEVSRIVKDLQGKYNLSAKDLGINVDKYRPVDVESVKALSPHSFEEKPPEQHEEIARQLNDHLGILRESAYNRIVNLYHGPEGDRLKTQLETAMKAGNSAEIEKAKKAYAEHALANNAKLAGITKAVTHDLEYGQWKDRKTGQTKWGRPSLIFAENLGSIDLLHHALSTRTIKDPVTGKERPLRVASITGGKNGKERDQIRNGFQDGNYDVLLLTSAGEAGLNLQNAKTLHHYDQPDTSKSHEQRTGRAVRLGQEGDVHVHNWITDTGHERRKHEIVQNKYELGDIFQSPADNMDDTGFAAYLTRVEAERHQDADLGASRMAA